MPLSRSSPNKKWTLNADVESEKNLLRLLEEASHIRREENKTTVI